MINRIFILLALVSTTAFSQTKKMEEQLIRKLRQESNAAIAAKDLEGVARHWADDFVLTRGNGTSVVGKDSIKSAWKKTFESTPETSYVRNPKEITLSENDPNLAWESGEWIGINTYSKGGKYSAMWRKKDGVWKIQAELFVALK